MQELSWKQRPLGLALGHAYLFVKVLVRSRPEHAQNGNVSGGTKVLSDNCLDCLSSAKFNA
eukprot:2703787-Pleurochrysis_carterae.AAC.1